jgi:asparagine synthase (glutamine-hydrolysing)
MCGIAGIYSKDEMKSVDRHLLKRMCDLMRHRGPDDEGYYVERNVGLGMRRLSIIDLDTGKQPIHNEDKTIWVVYNGEIYNFKELRRELVSNHDFYTRTDTEILVHLYEEYGDEFVTKLNGMFAFALWDSRKGLLYLARDRLGIKPLYYAEINGNILFSSEIKSILADPGVPRDLDIDALNCYLSYNYTPAPLTMYTTVKKLLPGHLVKVKGSRITQKQYWDIRYENGNREAIGPIVEEFLGVFRRSVKRQLISDVPLGAFLSGGIDSSAVVAVMTEYLNKPVETFSIGYGEQAGYFDERGDARLIVERFNTNHHEFKLEPDIIRIVPQIVRSLDEPLGDASTLPNYFLAEQTRKYVTVALSGLGGDELCAGYPRYAGMFFANYYKCIPRILREKLISYLILNLPDSKKGKRFVDRAKRFVKYADLPQNTAYFYLTSSFDGNHKAAILTDSAKMMRDDGIAETIFNDYFFLHENMCLLNRLFFTDMKMYLVDDLLTLTDKMSMAHSLEVRVPFLDNEFVDFMVRLPPEMKLKRTVKKYLFKKAFEQILPQHTLYKEKKGFSVPLVLWFRNDLKQFIQLFLSRERLSRLGYFDSDYILRLVKMHFQGRENHFNKIWGLLIFCIWHALYIEGEDIDELMARVYPGTGKESKSVTSEV